MDNFNFEVVDPGMEIDDSLFGEGSPGSKTVTVEKTKTPDVVKVNPALSKDVAISGDVDDDLFNNDEGSTPAETTSDAVGKGKTPSQKKTKDSPYKILHDELVSKGILDPEDEFDEQDEDGLLTTFSKREERIKDQLYSQIAEELGEKGLSLIQHLRNGGDVDDFVESYSNPLSKLDPNNEKHHDAIIRLFYKSQGWTDDETEEELEGLDALGKKENRAKSLYQKLKSAQEEKENDFNNRVALEKDQAKQRYEDTLKNITNSIDTKNEILGFDVFKDPKIKKELKDYILKPSVRLKDGRIVSQYYSDQMSEAGNMDIYLLKAYLTKNGYKIPEQVKTKAKTEAALTLKRKLEQSSNFPSTTTRSDNGVEIPKVDYNKLFG